MKIPHHSDDRPGTARPGVHGEGLSHRILHNPVSDEPRRRLIDHVGSTRPVLRRKRLSGDDFDPERGNEIDIDRHLAQWGLLGPHASLPGAADVLVIGAGQEVRSGCRGHPGTSEQLTLDGPVVMPRLPGQVDVHDAFFLDTQLELLHMAHL